MGRRATILTIGNVVERGDLARDYDEVEYVRAEEFLADDEAAPADADTIVQVGEGPVVELADQLIAALRRAGVDSILVHVEGEPEDVAIVAPPSPAARARKSAGLGKGKRRRRKSGGGGPASRRPASGRRRSLAESLSRAVRRTSRLERFWGSATLVASLVIVWRVQALSGDWLLALALLLPVLAACLGPLAALRAWRLTSQTARRLAQTDKRIRASRGATRGVLEAVERLKVQQARTATAVSLAAISIDEHLRFQSSRSAAGLDEAG